MGSDEEDHVRAQIEAADLASVFAAFPEDVIVAMEQAATYNRAVMEQRGSALFRGAMVQPEAGS